MYRDDRMTVPAAARKALHIEGEAEFIDEIAGDALLLRRITDQ